MPLNTKHSAQRSNIIFFIFRIDGYNIFKSASNVLFPLITGFVIDNYLNRHKFNK